MPLLWSIDHETGDFSQYDATALGGGDLSIGTPGLGRTSNSMKALVNDTGAIYATKNQTANNDQSFRFIYDPNTPTMTAGDLFTIFRVNTSQGSQPVIKIETRFSGGQHQISSTFYNDADTPTQQSFANFAPTPTDNPHTIEVYIKRAATSVSSDGVVTVWMDGNVHQTATGIDNFDKVGGQTSADLGCVDGLDSGTSGTFLFDLFSYRDDNTFQGRTGFGYLYVGKGGNDGNDGLSWANRKLTIQAAENLTLLPGDIVLVGPGTYREQISLGFKSSGPNGMAVQLVGDPTGARTDGVGGIVRITGSDDDVTATRQRCITDVSATNKFYRWFSHFHFDGWTSQAISNVAGQTGWQITDCTFGVGGSGSGVPINVQNTSSAFVISRNYFMGSYPTGCVAIYHTGTVSNTGHVISHNVFVHSGRHATASLYTDRVGGMTFRNNTVVGGGYGVLINTALAGGQTLTVNNNIFSQCTVGVQGTATSEIQEDYNAFYDCGTIRVNTNTGSNSVTTTIPFFAVPPLPANGFVLPTPYRFGELAPYSSLVRKTVSAVGGPDFYGLDQPTTAAKNSWGAVQHQGVSRETTTVRTGSASLKLADATRHQIFVPHDGQAMTFSVYCRREANHTGTAPQMVIKQPGQDSITVTDGGASGQWNLLTTTVTPAANPSFVVVELVSNNTATSGSYAVYFDDLRVL